jgi:hypothetical protein
MIADKSATAICVLCGEPTTVDQGELVYHQDCFEDVLKHGKADSEPFQEVLL